MSGDSRVEAESSLEINVDEGKINSNSSYRLEARVRNPKLPETREGRALLQWLENKVRFKDDHKIHEPRVEVLIPPGIYLELKVRPDDKIDFYFEVREGRYPKKVIDFLERSIYGEI